jgi:acyl-CoA thioester hydrolase
MGISPSQIAGWVDYPVIVQPHHTDYAGVVWHGSYLTWMEEARIAVFRNVGIEFADLVSMGCDLPVVSLNLNYHQAVHMGEKVCVRSHLEPTSGVRLTWVQNICALDSDLCYVSGRIVNVPIDVERRKIMRKFPPLLGKAIAQLTAPT